MSDIQEQIKLAHKRAEENDIKLLKYEINRLNNIIDELEKWLNDRSEFTNIGEVLNKLKELKEEK